MPGKPDRFAPEPLKHRLGKNKFDVRTPESMSNREDQYVVVLRTIENRHPDEDRMLQHYALQYVARREGTYNAIEDPPIILSDLTPTVCVVIDRVFSRDEAGSENQEVGKYVKKLAALTDFDVVPVYMGRPFSLPLHPTTAFKYKDQVMDSIMREFYESRQESASEILDRVECDRSGKDTTKKPAWHVFDGISEGGAHGPQTKITSIDDAPQESQKTWGERVDEAEQEQNNEDDENEEEVVAKKPANESWTEVKSTKTIATKKSKLASAKKRGGSRR